MYYYKEPLPFLDEIKENLKIGILDIMILKLLTERKLYGYEIKQLTAGACAIILDENKKRYFTYEIPFFLFFN